MRIQRSALAFLAAAAALAPLAASAHVGVDGGAHHGFAAGFMHPFSGVDHLCAMVAVGLWSALVARRGADLLWAPLGFASMLLAGALAGMAGLQVPGVEPMIAASLLALGLLVATRWRLPAAAATALVGVFAVFHGLAHGQELAGEQGAAMTLAGMLTATVTLHVAGIAIGWALRHANGWLPRVAGAGVALVGLALLGSAV